MPKVGKIRLKKTGEGWQIAHPEMDTPKAIINEPEVAQTKTQQKQNAGCIDKQQQMPKQIPNTLRQILMKLQIQSKNKPVTSFHMKAFSHILNPVPVIMTPRDQ